MSDEIYWCPRIWYWPYYGFCPNERAWYGEMKQSEKWRETGGFAAIPAYPDPKEANVTRLRLVETGDGEPVDKLVQIVTINERLDDKPIDTICGIIVHEAWHVFQHMCDEIEEDKPSHEFAAYTLQTIAQQLFKGYLTTRRPGEFVITPDSNEPAIAEGGSDVPIIRTTHPHPAAPPLPAPSGRTASRGRKHPRKAARPRQQRQ